MRNPLLTVARGVAAAMVLYVCVWILVPFPFSATASAQDAGVGEMAAERSWTSVWITSGGWGGFLILFAGLLCVVFTLVALAKAGQPARWPHWRGLVLGLGEAAFLMGILFSFLGLARGLDIVAQLGAAVTPADMAGGLSQSSVDIVLGALVALVAIAGAGLIRLREPGAATADSRAS